ncbi:MAG: thiamine diphosphokinase [Mediterranea sp.]|jgi:thiamine pyrophosphokinase|nr:thiamine diphosphokinase [Mediterranea sp.]
MVSQHYLPQAVILANGEYPAHPLPLRMLEEADVVVCCDGAANEYIARGHTPHTIIGDCDSLLPGYKERFARAIHPVSEQETNDQTKAVRFLAAQGIGRIAIVGATGKREDHTLGNISLLIEYMRQGIEARVFTDYGQFVPARDTRTFDSFAGQQVSIFSFGTRGMRSDGLIYPLSDFTNWWQGTLNEAKADRFTIHCEGEYLLFLAYNK